MFPSISSRLTAAAVAALLLVASGATAQSTTSFGVKGGITSADEVMSGAGIDLGLDRRLGPAGGLFVTIDPVERFGLQIEALFAQKGFTAKDVLEEGKYGVRLDYVEVPVLARINAPVGANANFHVLGGVSPAVLLHDTQTLDGDELGELERDDYKSFDLGLTVGAALSVRRALIDVRYTHGLLNVIDLEDDDYDFTVKNRAFTVMVGFRF